MLFKTIEASYEILNPCFVQNENGTFRSKSSKRSYEIKKDEDHIWIKRKALRLNDYNQIRSFSKVEITGQTEQTLRGYQLNLTYNIKTGYKVVTYLLLGIIIPLIAITIIASKLDVIVLVISIAILAMIYATTTFPLKTVKNQLESDIYDLEEFDERIFKK